MPLIQTLDWLFAQVLPENIPERVRHMRLMFFYVNLIQGGAALEAMRDTPFGDMSEGSIENIMDYFLDYVAAGLSAPTAISSAKLVKVSK